MWKTSYRLLTLLGSPFVWLYLRYRRAKGKEDPQRFRERLGYASIPRTPGPLIWFHAASVGESISVLPLIEALCKQHPDASVLVTTGTVTSASIVENRLPENAFHQFVPVDQKGAVRRFLDHWKPDLALWVESELWPNLVLMTQSRGIPMALLNARVSSVSVSMWKRFASLARELLQAFTVILAQSDDDARRFRELGAENVKFLGNLKFDSPPLPADPKATGELLTMFGERPTWLAASTHPGEEEQIGEVHQALKQNVQELLTVIVPRHANRGEEIAGQLKDQGLKLARRSKEEAIEEETDIYLADTMGELGLFYRVIDIVFMGGSLVPHGGQNPLEPARLKCAIIMGPHMENFAGISNELKKMQACVTINDAKQLQEAVESLTRDPARQEALAEAALKLVESRQGVLEAILNELEPLLRQIGVKTDETEDA